MECGEEQPMRSYLLILLEREVVDIPVRPCLEAFQQLRLNGTVQPSCCLSFLLSPLFTLFCPTVQVTTGNSGERRTLAKTAFSASGVA